jgi:CRP-like cAMP-binding protein
MKSQISRQINLAQHIIDGSIAIDSTKTFKSILQIFPNDPALHKAFGDLLIRKKSRATALKVYSKAAKLYIDMGMILQAVVCKLIQWRLQKPSAQEARLFCQTQRQGSYHETPLNQFFDRLSYSELIALIDRMDLLRLSAGQMIKKIGDEETDLYFIVSGNLKATTYQPLQDEADEQKKSTVFLTENDFFGDIYPFEELKNSQSYTETIGRTELVRIPKKKIIDLCRKYPAIELGIIDLFKARSHTDEEGILRMVRKTDRHKFPIKMNLEIRPGGADNHPIVLDGYTKDMSVGGMCIVLDAKFSALGSVYEQFQNAQIQISLPSEALTISVSGNIVWSNEVKYEGDKTVALGIQFDEMTPKLSGMLVVFADIIRTSEK